MNALKKIESTQFIASMSDKAIANVCELERQFLTVPQTRIPTHHLIHTGMYARTIMVPAGLPITGALMKIATILIISGDFILYSGDRPIELHGYHVFAGSPNRKQAGLAISDTWVTMIFPTDAKTVEEAEVQFTDDFERLWSRYPDAINHITITEA